MLGDHIRSEIDAADPNRANYFPTEFALPSSYDNRVFIAHGIRQTKYPLFDQVLVRLYCTFHPHGSPSGEIVELINTYVCEPLRRSRVDGNITGWIPPLP